MEEITNVRELESYLEKQASDTTLINLTEQINSLNGELEDVEYSLNDDDFLDNLAHQHSVRTIIHGAIKGTYNADDEYIRWNSINSTIETLADDGALADEIRTLYCDIIAENIEDIGYDFNVNDELIMDYIRESGVLPF